jgi:hypothetical protein
VALESALGDGAGDQVVRRVREPIFVLHGMRDHHHPVLTAHIDVRGFEPDRELGQGGVLDPPAPFMCSVEDNSKLGICLRTGKGLARVLSLFAAGR